MHFSCVHTSEELSEELSCVECQISEVSPELQHFDNYILSGLVQLTGSSFAVILLLPFQPSSAYCSKRNGCNDVGEGVSYFVVVSELPTFSCLHRNLKVATQSQSFCRRPFQCLKQQDCISEDMMSTFNLLQYTLLLGAKGFLIM